MFWKLPRCILNMKIQWTFLTLSFQDCAFFNIYSFPNKPWFLHVCSTSLLETQWEKEKLLVSSNFSFSDSVSYPFGELSAIFIKFESVVCKLFHILKSLQFVVWKMVKLVHIESICRHHKIFSW